MTLEDKIGQLFMVAAWSNKDTGHINRVEHLIRNHAIGGIIFFQGGPVRQARLTNRYQQLSKIPLLIGMDAEWGLAMRLDSVESLPRAMMMGAVPHDSLITQLAFETGKTCQRLGVHLSFSPVADVNNNPHNPVINIRSFGENKEKVAAFAKAYYAGLKKAGILACAKHFPGHGNTEADSHYELPVISADAKRLDSLELYPFDELFKAGIPTAMVAHLQIPAISSNDTLPSTLDEKIVNGLLREKMNFTGVIFTDALNMKAVANNYPPGIAEVLALQAGNDVLLYTDSLEAAVNGIKEAILAGTLSPQRIEQSCRRILQLKYQAGLYKKQTVNEKNLVDDLNNSQLKLVNQRVTENAFTLLKNNRQTIPLRQLDTTRIYAVSLGQGNQTSIFQESLYRYAPVTMLSADTLPQIIDKIPNHKHNLIILGLHYNTLLRNDFYQFPLAQSELEKLCAKGRVIIAAFGNPYALHGIDCSNIDAVIAGYDNRAITQDFCSQLIFGGIPACGKLPVTIDEVYRAGTGIELKKIIRFKFTTPEDAGAKHEYMVRADSIAMEGIREGAYPGCQVLAAKDGKIFYYKSFGSHSFDKKQPVLNTDLYDLASVTKIAATTISVMKLTDEKKFSLNDKLGNYLKNELDSSEYAKTSIKSMLAHQAGFVDWIPFFMTIVKNGNYDERYFRTQAETGYRAQVAENLYMLDSYEDTVFKIIKRQRISAKGKYKYSDLGFYFLKRVVYNQTGKPLPVYARENFYNKLGLRTLGYNPRDRFPVTKIPPTEYDTVFRKQMVHGFVHDQGAALLGGVGGHAGLFADMLDVAVIFQMLMNYGEYGGERYIQSSTIKEWTSCQFCPKNRRGAAFDRPTGNGKGPTCTQASMESFGHTGFTGITAWADPKTGIVYIFLSNRSHPDAYNPKVITLGIRTRIQAAFYNAFGYF
jgi:beta-glucosidase-like glycosyl hydrolase/CubicO group peptidase (beta-lactamase class C family)